ncbi:MAG: ATP-binding protein [Candidatus Dadabacteria bacterium]|nr:ATP-binding protein [Candidatus Dadabacteria bacterium]
MKTFWKYFLLNLFIISLVFFLFTILIIRELEKHDKALTEERLLTEAVLVREFLQAPVAQGNREEIKSLVSQFAHKIGVRITVIDKDGVVIGDSQEDPSRMENHAKRPEVVEAILKGTGKSIRYSTTVDKEMVYIAVPIKDENGAVEAVIRTALPSSSLEKVFSPLKSKIIYICLILVALALLLSIVSSRALTKSLERTIKLSQEIAKGDFNVSIPISDKKGEIGKLNIALGEMAEKLEDLFKEVSLEKSQLETVISTMSEGVMVVDGDGKIRLINSALKDMLEIKDDSIGKPYWEILRIREIMELVENVIKKQVAEKKEISVLHPVERYFLTSAIPLKSAEKEAIFVIFDITEFKRLERIKADIVANVSHELRTPLTAIKGYVETLEEGDYENPEERNRFLSIIKRHTDRLINIVSELLLLSEIERKSAPWGEEPKAAFEDVDLKEIVYSSLEALKSRVEEKSLHVSLGVKEDLPKYRGDRFLLEQMFINLIDNAVKYTPEGGTIGVQVNRINSEFGIEVFDTGVGIPKEHLPRIFERFYRADKTRARKLGGTGLGLSIVKHVVIMHSGEIRVESEVGKGSKFIVTLPV